MAIGAGRTIGWDAENRPLTITLSNGMAWSVTDASLQQGTIGLRAYMADAYFDDVKVRKLVSPEPLVTMGLTETVVALSPTSYYYAGSKRIAMRSGGALYYMICAPREFVIFWVLQYYDSQANIGTLD